jgi:predicted esterase
VNNRLTTALVAVLTTALSSRFVAAKANERRDFDVPIASQGVIGAWLMAGPFENGGALSPDIKPGQGTVEGQRWRSFVVPSGLVDYGGDVSLSPGKTQSSALGTWLRVETPFDGWLLVGADGALRIFVDGRVQYQRKVPHRRGHGVEPIPLRLTPGLHRILVLLERRDNRSLFEAVLRNRDDFGAPHGVSVVLPTATSQASLLSKLIDVKLTVDTQTLPLTLTLELSAPAGAPRTAFPISLDLVASCGAPRTHWEVGTWDLSKEQSTPFSMRLGPLDRLDLTERNELLLHVGEANFTRRFSLSKDVQSALEAAITTTQTQRFTDALTLPFDALRATVQFHLRSTVDAVFLDNPALVAQSAAQLSFFTHAIDSEKNPFEGPGWVQAALKSSYDEQPHAVFVHVPSISDLAPARKHPLVLVLHGYNGTPRKILEAFLDDAGPGVKVPGFVIAPEAYGNAFYRGAAERALDEALDWASVTYPIDPTKVTITGVSMGGTGAAEIAFRQSERFAAAAPLCGYQSFFVRRDTNGRPIRPWEKPLMHLFSPASWAPSGHDVPLYVAHGTLDFPLENSQVLTNRYRDLGYKLDQDWPNLGHAVWKKTYKKAGLFPWLTKWQKDPDPTYVRLVTGQLRLGRKFWLRLTEFEPSLELAEADARILPNNHVTVHTRGVSGLCLHETTHLDKSQPVHLDIDAQSLETTLGTLRCFDKSNGNWTVANGPKPALRKQPYIEGPWSDLLAEPLVVVYGTGNPNTARLNQFVAERLFQAPFGVTLRIPVISDVAYATRALPYRRAVYVGRPDDHLQYGSIAEKLPIRVSPQGLVVGSSHFDEPDVGAAFVYPDPERLDRLLGFVTGNGPEGLLRVLALPQLVPDFVVFDRGLDAAAGEPILGRSAFVRAAGFFQNDWSLPSSIDDSWAEARAR